MPSRVGRVVTRPEALAESTDSQDIGSAACGALERDLHRHELAALRRDPHFFAGDHAIGGDVHPLAVDLHVPVTNQLARALPVGGKTHPVDDVVEAGFQGHQQVGALDATLPARAVEGVAELGFREP
jgi:hypothetical protein